MWQYLTYVAVMAYTNKIKCYFNVLKNMYNNNDVYSSNFDETLSTPPWLAIKLAPTGYFKFFWFFWHSP
jgi:hypothetical protein